MNAFANISCKTKKENGSLWTLLRRANKKRKKRYGKADRRGIIPNKVMIDQRPSVVDDKTRVGDFEIDTIIGKGHKGAVVTIVDRKSKLLLAKPIRRRTAALVSNAIVELLTPYMKHTHTLTPEREACPWGATAKSFPTINKLPNS